ncbi:hypothetical protein E8F20_06865 [Pseudomonas sp. BN415]|uniref:hypothetical protein n=1 Tax=Pseudomonas sp. BN415 TaxID=2567889 RepID=UPI002457619A|nr:hypothetical protein [Pseudomonas sp. BN415]MDH4581594.1 hypothetical protein [Pseudomonas sp. BN415]
MVRDFLEGLPAESRASERYRAVRSFLKSYAGNQATLNAFGPMVKSRFSHTDGRKKQGTGTYILNSEWRPFSLTITKRECKIAAETVTALPSRAYRMSQGAVAQVFALCGSLLQHTID